MRDEDAPRSERIFRRGHVITGVMVALVGGALSVGSVIAAGEHPAAALAGLIFPGALGVALTVSGRTARESAAWKGSGLVGEVPRGAGFSNASACWAIAAAFCLIYGVMFAGTSPLMAILGASRSIALGALLGALYGALGVGFFALGRLGLRKSRYYAELLARDNGSTPHPGR